LALSCHLVLPGVFRVSVARLDSVSDILISANPPIAA
jgi:hypothetical protein